MVYTIYLSHTLKVLDPEALIRSRLGVKTRVFHLGDYRRATVGPGQDVPDDYFFVNGEELSQTDDCEVEVEALDDGAFQE